MWKAWIISVLLVLPSVAAADDYDDPRLLKTSQLLPDFPRKTKAYAIADRALADGFSYRFVLETPWGREEVTGRDLLVERVGEAMAIAQLEDRGTATTFAKRAGGTATRVAAAGVEAVSGDDSLPDKPKDERGFFSRTGSAIVGAPGALWRGTVGVVSATWTRIVNAPMGLWRGTVRAYDMATETRGEFEEGDWREVVGFSSAKRKLATDLGVDVYSSNPELQRQLGRITWAGQAGRRVNNVAMGFVPIPAAVRTPMSRYGLARRLSDLLSDATPEDLKRRNLAALADMGIAEESARRLLDAPTYSPRHETGIVLAMEAMSAASNRAVLLVPAKLARTEIDARRHMNALLLLAAVHSGPTPLARFDLVGQWPVAQTAAGGWVVPVPADHLMLTPETDAFLLAVRQQAGNRPVELWLPGSASTRFADAAARQNIRVVGQAWTRFLDAASRGR
jgi:hypothetical protein